MNGFRRPGFGSFSFFPPVIKYLLISNVLIFLLQAFFLDFLKAGSVNIGEVFIKNFAMFTIDSPFFRPWQVFTYMFLHGSFSHLFFNMFALWMFGLELENLWGSKTFLIFYTVCGVGAGIANLFLAPLFTTIPPNVPTVGASGSIYGVLIAFGYLFPDRHIYIYFLVPIKAKYLVMFYIALEVFAVVSQSQTGIAHIAHLGGGVVGFFFVYFMKKRNLKGLFRTYKDDTSSVFGGRKKEEEYKPPEPEKKVYDAKYEEFSKKDYENDIRQQEREAQEKIDAILDKLSEKGYQSLTEEEKHILFQESKKLR